ncbi:helix-turn-helix domain-containing protein [Marispirochaeta sp.]|uniref:helix-turn-helix domain-containing protein n=1 Tax=Marispirochaeta sp. TaxID=2038653 RepID=UPI0029C61CA0|nr:helix-turn-helix domain-containing protein [Marispirochaeta sp.]
MAVEIYAGNKYRTMFDTVRARFRERKFYIQLVVSMLFLAMLPIFVISAFLFINTQRAFERQIMDANLRYLRQTENAFYIVKNQIDSSFLQLILDNIVADYESYPDGKRLEAEAELGNLENSEEISLYFRAKDRVFNKLSGLRLSNRFIQSVYYYDGDKQTVLTDSWEEYGIDEYFDTSWVEFLQDDSRSGLTWNSRVAGFRYGPDRNVISVLLPSFKENNAFIVNLDADRLYRHIVQRTSTSSLTSIFLFDRNGDPVLYDEQLFSRRELSSLIESEDFVIHDNSGSRSILRGGSLLTFVSSPQLEWTFVSRTDLDSLYQHVHSLRRVFLVATSIILILAITIGFFATRRLYNPISRLVYLVGDLRKDRSPATVPQPSLPPSYGELDYIIGCIKESEQARRRLRTSLSESMPAYREKLVRSLIKPNSFNPDQLHSRLEFASIELSPENVAAMVVAVSGREKDNEKPEEDSLKRLWIADVIRSSIRSVTTGDVAETDDSWFVVIVNSQGSMLDMLFHCAEIIQSSITRRVEADCTIGIGSIQSDIGDLYMSYQEAVEALKHGMLAGVGEIVHIQDIRIGKVWPSEQFDDLINTMKDFIKTGDSEAARKVVEDIYSKLITQNREVPYREVQKVLTKVLIAITDSIDDVGGEWRQISPENDAPFATLSRISDGREVIHWFFELVDRASEYIMQARDNRSWCYADKVQELIANDCGRKVNLHWVAAQLNLNPSYLGRIFKEQIGINFIDYLTRVRINRSKELLRETDLTVEDVGKAVGYSNSYYFIKLFKEHTGTTPGKFKKTAMTVTAGQTSQDAVDS